MPSRLDLSSASRLAQGRITEMVAEASVQFNEKRAVKIREQVETEEAVETTSEVFNPNREITADYFCYRSRRPD